MGPACADPGRRRGARAAATWACLACLAGCAAPVPLPPLGAGTGELPPPVPEWVGLRVTEADHGRLIGLPTGASLAVSLRAPAAAGTGWVPAPPPAPLALVGRFSGPAWPPDVPAPRLTPPPVWQVFVLEARQPGVGVLAFELPGDGAAGVRRVRFTVEVRRP